MIPNNQTVNPGRLEAERQLENLRELSLAPGGGLPVMRALNLCMAHRLDVPDWLRLEFSRRAGRVLRAEAGTWDAAFGRPWRRGTPEGLQRERERMTLRAEVYEKVWQCAIQDRRAINAVLFDELAKDFGVSGSTLERHYYAALSEGRPSVAEVRRNLSV
jgi:hypothetical protein